MEQQSAFQAVTARLVAGPPPKGESMEPAEAEEPRPNRKRRRRKSSKRAGDR